MNMHVEVPLLIVIQPLLARDGINNHGARVRICNIRIRINAPIPIYVHKSVPDILDSRRLRCM